MNTKLKLSHDEMVVLTAIANKKMTWMDINAKLPSKRWWIPDSMIEKGLLVKTHEAYNYFYAIAPEILALNKSPYTYESWRALSE